MNTNWVTTATRYSFKSQWFNVRTDNLTLPCNTEIEYNTVEKPPFAIIVALSSSNQVILEKNYRHPIGKVILECPAGVIETDNPEQDAARELREETGYKSDHLIFLGNFLVSPGYSSERSYIYLAQNIHAEGEPELEKTEEIEVIKMPFCEAVALAGAGKLENMPSAFALLLADKYLQKNDKN